MDWFGIVCGGFGIISRVPYIVLKKSCAREYLYYRTSSPWLQNKLLTFLQLYPLLLVVEKENQKADKVTGVAIQHWVDDHGKTGPDQGECRWGEEEAGDGAG